MTKLELAISWVHLIMPEQWRKFENKNVHFRSETNQVQSILVSLATYQYEDFYLNIGLPKKKLSV